MCFLGKERGWTLLRGMRQTGIYVLPLSLTATADWDRKIGKIKDKIH